MSIPDSRPHGNHRNATHLGVVSRVVHAVAETLFRPSSAGNNKYYDVNNKLSVQTRILLNSHTTPVLSLQSCHSFSFPRTSFHYSIPLASSQAAEVGSATRLSPKPDRHHLRDISLSLTISSTDNGNASPNRHVRRAGESARNYERRSGASGKLHIQHPRRHRRPLQQHIGMGTGSPRPGVPT